MEDHDVKEKILKGAEELFTRYGVRSISMDDIARHLSVSKKTLYQHVADKDELVALFSTNYLDRAAQQYEALRQESNNSIEELAKIAVCMKRDLEKINPALLFDIQKFHPKAWDVWSEHKNRLIRESVLRNLSQGITDGYIRPDVNPHVMAVVRIELIQLAFNTDIFPPDQFTLPEVQLQIFDHFVYGLVTDKGRKLYQQYKQNQLVPHKTKTLL
jgi:AcrR family transcriptional regulator